MIDHAGGQFAGLERWAAEPAALLEAERAHNIEALAAIDRAAAVDLELEALDAAEDDRPPERPRHGLEGPEDPRPGPAALAERAEILAAIAAELEAMATEEQIDGRRLERSAAILRLRADGGRLEELGRSLRITRERVRQLEMRGLYHLAAAVARRLGQATELGRLNPGALRPMTYRGPIRRRQRRISTQPATPTPEGARQK